MDDITDTVRLQLSEHFTSGTALRNDGLFCAMPDDALTWKTRELEWATELYEIIAQIDQADVERIRTLKEKNGPIAQGEIGVRLGNPLLTDPYESLLCHDTRLDRLEKLITEYGERFGPVRRKDGVAHRNSQPARLTAKATEKFLKERWEELNTDGKRSNWRDDEIALLAHYPGRSVDRDLISELRLKHVPKWTKKGRRKTNEKMSPVNLSK